MRVICWTWLIIGLAATASTTAEAVHQVGINFVDDVQTIDFIDPFTFGDPPITLIHQIEPWQLTAGDSPFVTEGAFAGLTEDQAREKVYFKVIEKFFSIPTPDKMELDIDLIYAPVFGPVSGPTSTNAIIGQHTVTNTNDTDSWFGLADYGGGLEQPNGQNLAAISADRLAAGVTVPFDTRDKAVNALANIIAHEIAHLYFVNHVCADAAGQDCDPGDPVVSAPYDVMSTGFSGLPISGWVEDNIFTTIPDTQAGGLSTVDRLIAQIGLRRLGDTDDDGDVDTADITRTLGNFPGGWDGPFILTRYDGDTDHDFDVDTADITTVIGNFTGANSAPLFSSLSESDSDESSVRLDVSGAGPASAGGVIYNRVADKMELGVAALGGQYGLQFSIPEPSSAVLYILGLLYTIRRRRPTNNLTDRQTQMFH